MSAILPVGRSCGTGNAAMNIERIIITRSEQETEAFASAFARKLAPGTILALSGDLGAGKTVFSRGFARGLGITEPVSSPTYTIVQEYPLPGRSGMLYHLDLYRIENSASALAFGVDEFFDDPESMVLVEWPERIADILPDSAQRIEIRHLSDTERGIILRQGR